MEPVEPNRPFSNWGDWLITRSTGTFGDFRMPVCIAIIRTEMYSRGWVSQMSADDIRRVLARHKAHVTYWNIALDVIQRELTDFANVLGLDPEAVIREYNRLPATRLQADFFEW